MDLSQLLTMTGNSAYILVVFVVALSVIVAVHEYGHYIVGRWCGIDADVFSVGFGPVLASRVDKRGTKWQLAAIPFGGYVKFAGDKNAASVGGVENLPPEVARRTMMGAPLWARSATVVAGPVANFILAVLIFAGYTLAQGQTTEKVIFEQAFDLPAGFESELLPGDEVISVDGILIGVSGEDSVDDLPKSPQRTYVVVRDGVEMEVNGPNLLVPRVDRLFPRSAADDAKLKIDDVIVAVDGVPTYAFADIVTAVEAVEGAPILLDVWREGEIIEVELAPRRVDNPLPDGTFETRWMIGIGGEYFFEQKRESVGVWESLEFAFDRLWFTIKMSLNGLWEVITGGISSCNISGPVAIAQASGSMASQGAGSYILFIGMISAAIGLFNLFPVPVLDGGHLVFHAYEAVTRRKPDGMALQVLMFSGLALIGSLMVFALLNDLVLCP